MPVILNKNGINALKINLGLKLYEGCVDGAEILRNNTPIDTKRLWRTTRAMPISITQMAIRCGILAGGMSIKGILREQNIKKDVTYAIWVNNRTNYIEETIPEIARAMERSLDG
jgi:hypothetical protein